MYKRQKTSSEFLIHLSQERKFATNSQDVGKTRIRRFRPTILTALTTFFGQALMIFEASVQARFLVPMAISLGYGILFFTFVILILTPTLHGIHQDFSRASQKTKGTKNIPDISER